VNTGEGDGLGEPLRERAIIVRVTVTLVVSELVTLSVLVLDGDDVTLKDALAVPDVLTARTEAETAADGEEEMLAEIVADAEVEIVGVNVTEGEGDADAQNETVGDAENTGVDDKLADTVGDGDGEPLVLAVLVLDPHTDTVTVVVTVREGDKLELVDTDVDTEGVLDKVAEFVNDGDTETETVADVETVAVVEGETLAVGETELVVDGDGVCVPVDVTLVLVHAVSDVDAVELVVALCEAELENDALPQELPEKDSVPVAELVEETVRLPDPHDDAEAETHDDDVGEAEEETHAVVDTVVEGDTVTVPLTDEDADCVVEALCEGESVPLKVGDCDALEHCDDVNEGVGDADIDRDVVTVTVTEEEIDDDIVALKVADADTVSVSETDDECVGESETLDDAVSVPSV
jgi:hypothetical protein